MKLLISAAMILIVSSTAQSQCDATIKRAINGEGGDRVADVQAKLDCFKKMTDDLKTQITNQSQKLTDATAQVASLNSQSAELKSKLAQKPNIYMFASNAFNNPATSPTVCSDAIRFAAAKYHGTITNDLPSVRTIRFDEGNSIIFCMGGPGGLIVSSSTVEGTPERLNDMIRSEITN